MWLLKRIPCSSICNQVLSSPQLPYPQKQHWEQASATMKLNHARNRLFCQWACECPVSLALRFNMALVPWLSSITRHNTFGKRWQHIKGPTLLKYYSNELLSMTCLCSVTFNEGYIHSLKIKGSVEYFQILDSAVCVMAFSDISFIRST